MYPTLFQLAGLAMAGWALLILLPRWSFTRRVAETAVFPVYLGVLYIVGIVPLIIEAGPGIMRDFGNVEGVLGLLGDPDVALIAWIHILAFDHLIGVLLYRDNMRHRFVPLPVQSVLLFLTLMFGPVGFVSYYVIRTMRRRRAETGLALGDPETVTGSRVQAGETARSGPDAVERAAHLAPEAGVPTGMGLGSSRAEPAPRTAADHVSDPAEPAPRTSADLVSDPAEPAPRTAAEVLARLRSGLALEPGLTGVGMAGLLIAFLCLIAVAVRGSFILPEGKMLDAATFTFGVAIFTLTVALLLPLAGYSEPARRRYRRLFYVFPVYAFVIEPVQAFRGLDPRFTAVGGPADQIAGAVFGLTALLVTLLFVILGIRFFRRHVLEDRPLLRMGIRYGAVAVAISFSVGILMSAGGGRGLGEAGNLLLAHGLGVHGIQVVPLVALLFVWGGTGEQGTIWLHAAGLGWLAACAAAVLQAVLGRPPLGASMLPAVTVVGIALWVAVAAYAFTTWRVSVRAVPVVTAATLP